MKKLVISLSLLAAVAVGFLAAARGQTAGDDEVPGKHVTVSLKEPAPLRSAFDQLTRQTDLRFTLMDGRGQAADPDNQLVSFEMQDKPLWETLQLLLEQAGQKQPLHWNMSDATNSPVSERVAGHLSSKGPFLLVAKTIAHMIDYARSDNQPESLLLDAQLFTDPFTRIISVGRVSGASHAVDDRGNSLVLPKPPAPLQIQLGGGTAISPTPISIYLQYPANGQVGTKISSIEGVVSATYSVPATIDIPLGTSIEREIEGFVITASCEDGGPGQPALPGGTRAGAGAAAAGVTLTVRIRRNDAAAAPLGSIDPLTGPNRAQARYLDASGTKFRGALIASNTSGDMRTLSYRFALVAVLRMDGAVVQPSLPPANPGEPAHVVFQIPLTIKETRIPYHFENIPLP